MAKVLTAILVIFAILVGWIWVQQAYARFAARHPELGPHRPDGGCGGGCSCSGGSCERD